MALCCPPEPTAVLVEVPYKLLPPYPPAPSDDAAVAGRISRPWDVSKAGDVATVIQNV
jgi:hypothetical protein